MGLMTIVQQKRLGILRRWISLIFETYPPDISGFLKVETDRFANPVGYTITKSSETLFDELIHGAENKTKIISALDNIIRIRAVQDFNSSQAIDFVFLLKKAVREELKINNEGFSEKVMPEILKELELLQARVDDLASLAFDVYGKCREDINRIKISRANISRTTKNRLKNEDIQRQKTASATDCVD